MRTAFPGAPYPEFLRSASVHALRLVHLYAEKDSPKYERAAMKWLHRYLEERSPTLKNFTKVVRSLEEREL